MAITFADWIETNARIEHTVDAYSEIIADFESKVNALAEVDPEKKAELLALAEKLKTTIWANAVMMEMIKAQNS